MPQNNLTEKISVNVNTSVLSQIDLLVDNGYYSNRSDFVNQAIRTLLDGQQSVVERIIEDNRIRSGDGKQWFVGFTGFDAETLEHYRSLGKKIKLTGYGVLSFEKECTDELIFDVFESIKIRGSVRCSDAVKEHYGIK